MACDKICKKVAFEKAISVDKKEVNIADTINLDSMSEHTYIVNFINYLKKIIIRFLYFIVNIVILFINK